MLGVPILKHIRVFRIHTVAVKSNLHPPHIRMKVGECTVCVYRTKREL